MNSESQNRLMLRIIILCFASYCFFPQFIPEKIQLGLVLLGTFFAMAYSFKRGFLTEVKLQSISLLLVWVFFSLFALVSCLTHHGLRPELTLALVLFAIVMLFASIGTGWIDETVWICIMLLSVYSISTIVLCVFPDLYAPIKATFFPMEVNATDYRSGLTTHYSNNGTYNALGFILASCSFLFFKNRPKHKIIGVLALVFFVALFLTTKRAHLMFSIVAVLFVYLASSSNKGRFGKALLVTVIALGAIEVASAYIPAIADTIARFTDTFAAGNFDDVDSGRHLLWDFALSGWDRSPIFGNGWTTYFYVWADGFTTTIFAHNELYNLLYETGIVGAAFAILLICASLFFTLYLSIKSNSIECSGHLKTSLCLQVFALIYGFSSGSLFGSQYYFMPYLLAVGMTVSVSLDLRASMPSKLSANNKEVPSIG